MIALSQDLCPQISSIEFCQKRLGNVSGIKVAMKDSSRRVVHDFDYNREYPFQRLLRNEAILVSVFHLDMYCRVFSWTCAGRDLPNFRLRSNRRDTAEYSAGRYADAGRTDSVYHADIQRTDQCANGAKYGLLS